MDNYTLTEGQALDVFYALRHSHPVAHTAEAYARHDRALDRMRELTNRVRMATIGLGTLDPWTKTQPYDIGHSRSIQR